jgi:tetratricopeptide (TPR) repeat protein
VGDGAGRVAKYDAQPPMAPPERPRRAPQAGKSAGPRKPFRKAGDAAKKPYQRRDDGPKKPYQRRDDGPKKPYQRRDDAAGARKPYQRREAPPTPIAREDRKGWGGVTRRGARQVMNPTPQTDESKAYERREHSRAPRPEVDRWERDEKPAPRRAATPRKPAPKGRAPRAKSLPADVVAEVASASTSARRAPMLQKRLGDAARHIQHGRDKEAASVLRELAQEVPEAASVRELYGQALYSLGRYKQAATEFEAFVALTASTDQHPMLADCYRALGRHKKVQELWAELKESSPGPEIVSEGRIVTAGSLADQGKLHDAIKLLETAPPVRGRVAERHMRTWYALADLYERSGELSKSRALFQRVVQHDADFADAADRLRGLG